MTKKRRHEQQTTREIEVAMGSQSLSAEAAEDPTLPSMLAETLEAIRANANEARRNNVQTIIELEQWRAEIDAAIAFLRAKS
jgi:hypothetical protein